MRLAIGAVTFAMDDADARPRTAVVLERDGPRGLLGPVYGSARCDLGFGEDLLRAQLVARRSGWAIRIVDGRLDLLELVELAAIW